MKDMAHCGTRVVHCPSANLKLASGIADVVGMHKAGMTVGIGADGAPCNNRLDAWTQMREAALLAKVKRKDASALAASRVLEMATIDGAKILGIDDMGTVHIRFVGWDAGHDIKITEQDRNELMRILAPRFPVESVVSTAPTSPASSTSSRSRSASATC